MSDAVPQTCATYNLRTLNPIDFKLGILININMKMICLAGQWVNIKANFDFFPEGDISVLQTSLYVYNI